MDTGQQKDRKTCFWFFGVYCIPIGNEGCSEKKSSMNCGSIWCMPYTQPRWWAVGGMSHTLVALIKPSEIYLLFILMWP